ncbi:amidohydrolase family protein [Salinimicrobium soli]|uniref:amidohydrolase family protein n=1 Tax=Salinimicrobium soli TaxID=1254399 RepID=UPI003AAEA222
MKRNVLLMGLLITLSFSSGSNPEQNNYKGPIIDMHMHTGLFIKVPEGMPAICRPEPCEGKGGAIVNQAELLKKTLEIMDRYNVQKGFLSGADWKEVQDWKNAAPDRFIASPFILDPKGVDLEKLKAAYEQEQFEGLGEIATQLSGIKPNDPSLEPFFQLAEERNLPVLIHTLGIGPEMPTFRSSAGNPLLLEDVLVKHPKLRLFVENAGFPFTEEMIAMMYQYPQLYVDVSTITWVIPREAFYDHFEALIKAGLEKRIMFGSDQMVWPDKIGAAVEAIDQAPFLNYEQKEDIFYNNAARFLRLNNQ